MQVELEHQSPDRDLCCGGTRTQHMCPREAMQCRHLPWLTLAMFWSICIVHLVGRLHLVCSLLMHVDLLPAHYHLFILYIHTERGMDCLKDNLNNEGILYVNFFLNNSCIGVKCFLRCSGRRYIPINRDAFSLPSEYPSELQSFWMVHCIWMSN